MFKKYFRKLSCFLMLHKKKSVVIQDCEQGKAYKSNCEFCNHDMGAHLEFKKPIILAPGESFELGVIIDKT